MEYQILVGEFSYELKDKVDEALADGWKLQGGVSVIWRAGGLSGDLEWNYAQAMTKEF